MIQGVPDSTDGRLIGISENAGVNIVNKDRMWHYTEGVKNYSPIWKEHGIRIMALLLWFDAEGHRMKAPDYPGSIPYTLEL